MTDSCPPRLKPWATQPFGPLDAELGEWSSGRNAACPYAPIPALTPPGKVVLVMLLTVGGAMQTC